VRCHKKAEPTKLHVVQQTPFQKPPIVVVVVAHPDDETIWCGGWLLRLRDAGAQLIIVSATCARHPERRAEFFRVCEVYSATPIMLDHSDQRATTLAVFDAELSRILGPHLDEGRRPALVLTHAPTGNENAHPHHIRCYVEVSRWAQRHRYAFGVFSEVALHHLRRIAPQMGQHGIVACLVVQNLRVFFTDQMLAASRQAASFVRTLLERRAGPIAAPFEGTNSVEQIQFNALSSLVRRLFERILKLRSELSFNPTVEISLQVDVNQKHTICKMYSTQVEGLMSYQAFRFKTEYLYLCDRSSLDMLQSLLA
jgi:LmbE family N-acetylglucosaminyl deacetylase